eukprot:m.337630 g.337630  ORF g.337630 m.337630 type:complete len:403 (-) comp20556_c0_seq1:190-1398(-)
MARLKCAPITAATMLAAMIAVGLVQGQHPPGPPEYNCSSQPPGTYDEIILKNSKGMEARFIRYGATLTHLIFPDSEGKPRDVVLGWDDTTQYCANPQHTYFGATIGRVANRIANGSFTLNGMVYDLPLNDHGIDTLHGGWLGYDRRVWSVIAQNRSSVTFSMVSWDGEEGFPGAISINVTHTLTDENEWVLQYAGRSLETALSTVLAMTNHAYFNLNANVDDLETVLEHVMTMPTASTFVEVDSTLIPTGVLGSVAKDAPWLDFRTPKRIGADINRGTVTPLGGYDNAWVFERRTPDVPGLLHDVVTITSPRTGISVAMSTDQPSVQVYTGNFLNGTDPSLRIARKASQCFSKDKPCYYQWRGAVTMEAQHFPDSVHQPSFPTIVLGPGAHYTQHTRYRFSS